MKKIIQSNVMFPPRQRTRRGRHPPEAKTLRVALISREVTLAQAPRSPGGPRPTEVEAPGNGSLWTPGASVASARAQPLIRIESERRTRYSLYEAHEVTGLQIREYEQEDIV